MAYGLLPEPGTDLGPCLPDCAHVDCKQTREQAESVCRHCGEAIGYDRPFVHDNSPFDPLDAPATFAHSACHEAAFAATEADVRPANARRGAH